MKVFREIEAYREWRRRQEGKGRSIGFVPTLGALHLGHRFLMDRARDENDRIVVSLYKNPTQFNDLDDLENYPDLEEVDLEVAQECGVDVVFAPAREALYPDGYQYRIVEEAISREMEGVERPGHFEGVLTVVMKLLLITGPNRAYFGKKDYQQLLLVQRLVNAFFLEVEVVACVTIRDGDGLAFSSRNALLNARERERAALFPQILKGARSAEEAREQLLLSGFGVDYVEVWEGRILGAVRIGKVRLIDNFPYQGVDLEASPASGREERR